MQNLEIKVRCATLDAVRQRAYDLGAGYRWTRRDTDTYFRVSSGRLKLRETEGFTTGTLIAYQRPDQGSSRLSDYRLLPIEDPESLKAMLSEALGVLVVVSKKRELFMYGTTRIHLDEVEGLGCFVELETVLGEQSQDEARREHDDVKEALGLDAYEPVPVSYSDLVLRV